jgi:hypothetical protein
MVLVIGMTSCESPDQRHLELVQRLAEQEARQSERFVQQAQTVVQQSQEVTAAAHDLVEQDAAARRELIQAQDKLHQQHHSERIALNEQRQKLDAERKAAAQAAVRDPVIANAIITCGLVMAALLPLLVTLYALMRLPEQRPMDELLVDPLIEELVVGGPTRLPPAPEAPSLPQVGGTRLPDS